MWDLYFFWRFDCKERMTAGEFGEQVKLHLDFLFNENETMPDLMEAIKELYTCYLLCIEDYYQCSKKNDFVEKYSKKYL